MVNQVMKLRGCLPEDLFFSVRAQEEDVEEGPAPAVPVGDGVAGVPLEELERPTVVQVCRMTPLELIVIEFRCKILLDHLMQALSVTDLQ